ncbi:MULTISPECIES: DUF3604 domain-containing protein [unclassified Novosphingobium]|uniref:DUF3604 domain-containing protein n=1 Tax=unclassified Novosphingobium TaxID=2644732 RepID=UPI000ECC7046|nr:MULTISPECIES: DUF3604 domain-containing protein [unclassified Novosphingobium]HCF25364.1 hypothetical protein [Novosphingobium sp.]HQV04117.1 DUF3604 domain-containing protein [Novosphingobium sp.]
MKLLTCTALCGLAIGAALTFSGQSAEPAKAETLASVVPPINIVTYPDRVLWGDTHLHTTNSFDAFAAGNRLSPDDALRFARGEEVTSSTGIKAKLARPLDFLVVADHSDAIGVTTDLYNTPEDQLKDPILKRWRNGMHGDRTQAYKTTREIIAAFQTGKVPEELNNPARIAATTRRIWDAQIDSVERYNEPGQFTALHGFEYSLQLKGNSLHRNVIFRDGADRARTVVPFASAGNKGPEPLWDYMEAYQKATGGKVLAIPHNSNLSNGAYFPLEGPGGQPFSAEQARRRAAMEPLIEVTQYKGDSESHPFLSRNDEFASFGDAGWENGNAPLLQVKQPGMFAGEYAREALKRGLQIARQTGANPYAFGLIGSTDSHTALSTADEDNFYGKMVSDEPNPTRMEREVNPGIKETRFGHQYLAGGMAAVWAPENTRAAIFDAMMRREVYATTGPRMTVRIFAGWDFSAREFKGDWVGAGYARGVPMGGVMKPGPGKSRGAAPTLLISALKDPQGANLDRVQVIKGWVDAQGISHEQVFDVVWSAPAKRRIVKGRLTPVGDTVDLATATYRNTIGAATLSMVWRDPAFRPDQRAFYYVRVLEIPTPRWTAFDAVRFKVKPPAGARLKDQERAYTSPIWYEPTG